jgi:malonate-semialdehyde dehydrogenase (acetylating) / methylmalonate-semialdehyde dehydrogenase
MERISHWIGGAVTPGDSGRQGEVFDPATGEVIAVVDYAAAAEVDTAVDVAARAFRTWGRGSLSTRTEVLFRFRSLLDANRGRLAQAITCQHGKVLDDARGEVGRGIEVVEFACGIPQLLQGGFSAGVSSDVDSYTFRQPLGVVAGITPFNFPVMVPMWMHPLAIACGNTFVLKPSERDPGASMLVAHLWKEAGLPDGVFNVVHGDRVAVEALVEHPRVGAISFVGSTPVARSIHHAAATAGKKVQALGGAKNHMVVLPDADIDAAADAAVSAAFGSAGERCMAVSVVIAVGPAADRLVTAVTSRAAKIEVGPGSRAGVEMGPLITAAHRDRVAALVGEGEREGASLVLDGRGTAVQDHPNGFWLGPCVLDGVRPEMKAYREEIFGPVLEVIRAESLEEAIEIINDNPYGNGTAIFTSSGGSARRFEQEVQVGMIGVNVPIPVPTAHYSFGGWKDSLFGESHIYGDDGVRFYTRGKVVTRRWPEARSAGVDLAFPGQRRG